MSMKYMIWAWEQELESPMRKLILLKLADNSNDDGVCWPSYGNIAKVSESSKSTVIRHVKAMVEAGLLEITLRPGEKGNSSNIFKLNHEVRLLKGGVRVTPGGCQSDTPPGSRVTLGGCQSDTQNLPMNHPVESTNESVCVKPTWLDEFYELTWKFYPKKVDKKKSMERLKKLINKEEHKELAETIAQHIQHKAQITAKEYWPTLDRFLRDEKWNDEVIDYEANRAANNRANNQPMSAVERVAAVNGLNTDGTQINPGPHQAIVVKDDLDLWA